MFQRILIPLDPSKRLGPAREYGLALAQHFQSTPVGTYIIAPTKTGTGAMALNKDLFMVPAGERAIEAFKQEAAGKGLKAEGNIVHGYRDAAFAKSICDGQGDSLVLGSFRSHLTRFFTGSEDERIVDVCRCPLFIIRERAPLPKPGQTLLVPYDGVAFQPADVEAVEAVAHRFGCKVHLLHFCLKSHRASDDVLERTRGRFPSQNVEGAESVKHRHYQHFGPLVKRALKKLNSPMVLVPLFQGSDFVSYRLLHDLIMHSHAPLCLLRGPHELYEPMEASGPVCNEEEQALSDQARHIETE